MTKIQSIAIVGAGQMGRGIAQVSSMAGYEVFLFDVSDSGLDFGHQFIKLQLEKGVSKGKWDESYKNEVLSRIHKVNDFKELSHCDLAIEAATENKDVKFKIFQELDQTLNQGAILASNTSSISITAIGSHTNRADKVVGMHFMNPVPVMKLIEGIRGLETSDVTFDTVSEVATKMGKVFVRAHDVPGFAVNRILMPMINEAVYALFEGVSTIEDIDQAMKLGTNVPMGPFELADFIGLDTCLAIMNVLHTELGDTKYRPCPLLKNYVAAGRLGRKSKRGFYEY